MNREIIRNELKWLLEAINEQYEAIRPHDEKIPQIEFDILMENVRKFYEKMYQLQRLNDPAAMPERKMKTEEADAQATAPGNESIEIVSAREAGPVKSAIKASAGVTVTFSDPEPLEGNAGKPDDPLNVPFQAGIARFRPDEPGSVKHENSPASKKAAKQPEIDLFAAEEPAFSIKLKDAREKTFGPKIPSERIENLKAAISINEKFMFINELFDGNLREYNETIETLNGLKTLDQAADFLDLMRKKNFWNTGSNAFRKLKELVERRF